MRFPLKLSQYMPIYSDGKNSKYIKTHKLMTTMDKRTLPSLGAEYMQKYLFFPRNIVYRTQKKSYVYGLYVVSKNSRLLLSAVILLVSSFIPVYSESNLTPSSAHSDYAQGIADYIRVDLSAIAKIESSGNPGAIGDGGKALGLYQIHPALIQDWNKANPSRLKAHSDALEPITAHELAEWYLHTRIPQILKWLKKPITKRNILICWNAGCGRVANPPAMTRAYIAKYEQTIKNKG